MSERQKHVYLPAISIAGSFFCLLTLALLTSPIRNIAFAGLFFILLFVLMLSFGYLLTYVHTGEVKGKAKYKIVLFSLFLLILIMFRSAQSLSWVDALALLLITLGMNFYFDRRLS